MSYLSVHQSGNFMAKKGRGSNGEAKLLMLSGWQREFRIFQETAILTQTPVYSMTLPEGKMPFLKTQCLCYNFINRYNCPGNLVTYATPTKEDSHHNQGR